MRRNIYDYFFLALLGCVLFGILKLLSPFAGAVLGAVICAVTFHPMYKRMRRWLPHRSATLSAALSDLIIFIFFVTPVLLLAWAMYQESAGLIEAFKQGSSTVSDWRHGNVSNLGSTQLGSFLADSFGIRSAKLEAQVLASINRVVEHVSAMVAAFAGNLITAILNLFIMLFALFFLFRDGEKWLDYFHDLVPMRRENKKRLRIRMRDTIVGVVRGWLMTAFLQGLLAMSGYLIIRAEGAVLLGALTAVMGLFPVVGTFGISIPVAIYFLSKGESFKGIFLLVWGIVVVVGLTDTVVRPYLMGRRAELPMFALFFALLGGVEIWGAKGMILGPLLIGVAPVLLDVYRQRYLRQADYMDTEGASCSDANPKIVNTTDF